MNLAQVASSLIVTHTLVLASSLGQASNIPPTAAEFRSLADEVQAMRGAMAQEKLDHDAEVAGLRDQLGAQWLSEERAAEIRGVVHDVLADSDTRRSFQGAEATSGYDSKNGFFIASADGNFMLKLSGKFQYRYAYRDVPGYTGNNPGLGTESGFQVGYAKFYQRGHMFDPTWQYELSQAFSQSSANLKLETAYVRKDLGNGLTVTAGQWKDRVVFEEFTSDTKQQFVSRSVVTHYFDTKRVLGLATGYTGDSFRGYASFNNGGNSNGTSPATSSTTPSDGAFSGRADWKLAGSWNDLNSLMSFRGSEFTAAVGAAAHYEWNRTYKLSTAGVNGTANNFLFTADLNLRFGGASVLGAFYLSQADFGAGVTPAATGILVQGGYFVCDDVEAVANWQFVNVDSNGSSSETTFADQEFWIATLGVNYYLDKNNLKFQVDGGWSNGAILFTNGVYGDSTVSTDWVPDSSDETQVVIRAAVQMLF
ncbi:MAG: porin [Planctomycetota bacterium]|nr:porin [Planctomycetota bacterium]